MSRPPLATFRPDHGRPADTAKPEHHSTLAVCARRAETNFRPAPPRENPKQTENSRLPRPEISFPECPKAKKQSREKPSSCLRLLVAAGTGPRPRLRSE